MERGKTVFFIFVGGFADAHSSGVETLLPWSDGCPPGHRCFVSRNPKMQTAPLVQGRDLRWSSFLNNFEAGNSRVLSREFPQITDTSYGTQRSLARTSRLGLQDNQSN